MRMPVYAERKAFRRTAARAKPTGRGESIPAPVEGWDALSSLSNMRPARAVALDNIFPQPGYVELRKGSDEHSDTGTAEPVESLMAYHGATPKLFASADGNIYDVTSAADASDGNDQYTKVLLHFEGTDGGTTITDNNLGGSSHTWTAAGNANTDDAQEKFGTTSLGLDGTGDYVSTPDHADFELGSSDFTIECWFNTAGTTGGSYMIASQADAGGADSSFNLFIRNTDVLRAEVFIGAGSVILEGTTQFTDAVNTGWHHVALVRDGSTLRLFVDGVQEDSDAIAGSVNNSAFALTIGNRADTGADFNGWIDEFRLSVGVARWTAAFTPPTTAYGETVALSGLTSDRWQHVNFTTIDGLNTLWICNGADDTRRYDGSSWSTNVINNVTDADIIGVNVFKGRLWLVEDGTLNPWYLAVGAVQGDATEFPLQGVFRRGGQLMAIGTWSLDAGAGPDDVIAFISSRGEVAVYSGIDPAADFTLKGVYSIAPPIGRRCLTEVGGDLMLITIDGVLPLSQALVVERGVQQAVAITRNIQPVLTQSALDWGANFGWQLISYPRGTRAILNVPVSEGSGQRQYVMNTLTGAWCRFLGMEGNCWEVFNDRLFFGGNDGIVYEADVGGSDDGAAIEWDMRTAFNYFHKRGQLKCFTMCRPLLTTDGVVEAGLAINTDFGDDAAISVPESVQEAGALWDAAVWDVDVWPVEQRIVTAWRVVTGSGYCGSVRMAGSSLSDAAAILQVNGFDLILEDGAFV